MTKPFKSPVSRRKREGYSKVVECVPHSTPKERKSVARLAPAGRATLFLSLFCRRRRLVLAEQWEPILHPGHSSCKILQIGVPTMQTEAIEYKRNRKRA